MRLAEGVELLADYQQRLAAQNTYAVLMIIQGIDAAGKDGTIKHVMSGVNPQGVAVHAFKVAVGRGSEPRLPVALPAPAARARPHRDLQPVPLRGSPGRARAPGSARPRAAARRATGEPLLGAALPGDQRLGALPDRQRHPHRQGLPAHLARRAARAPAGADRRPVPQLEVLAVGPRRAPALGRVPAGVLGDAQQHEHRVGALAHRAGQPQVVRARRDGGHPGRRARTRSTRSTRRSMPPRAR